MTILGSIILVHIILNQTKKDAPELLLSKEMTKTMDDSVYLRQDSPGDIGTCHQTTSFLFEPVLRIHVTPRQPGSTCPY